MRRFKTTITPEAYAKVTLLSLAALALIVFSGSAVRLTGSGLGCPDWPKCYGQTIPPLGLNTYIEFGNRLLSGVVGLIVIAASLLAFRRRPFRRHLAIIGAILPIGVVGQAVLGGLVVKSDLAPQLVIGHFILSMILLDAAYALYWCARHEPNWRPPSQDRRGVWAVRGLIPFGQLTVLVGTITTASGPHAGEHEGQLVQRFDFRGGETLSWMVQRHSVVAAAFGLAAVAAWLFVRRRGGDRRAQRPLTVLVGLLAIQGVVGFVQYQLELPAALVWLHVALATLTWITTLWAVAAAGRLVPSEEPAVARSPRPVAT